MSEREALEARMLSGKPFTYGGLCAARKAAKFPNSPHDGDPDRLIDRTIQALRRKGKISFVRERGLVLWSAT